MIAAPALAHDLVYWTRLATDIARTACFVLLAATFWRFRSRSAFRATCTALVYTFAACAILSGVRTVLAVVRIFDVLPYFDIAVSGVVAVATHAIWKDTTRDR